jgi:hypothetical protein
MATREGIPHVVIALARCGRLKDLFGIRFEEKQGNTWTGTWAFKIKEETAKKEGYDRDMIKGSFAMENYPGCPYCGARGFFICGRCGRVVCLSENVSEVTCSWCGNKGRLQISEQLEFRTGKDR